MGSNPIEVYLGTDKLCMYGKRTFLDAVWFQKLASEFFCLHRYLLYVVFFYYIVILEFLFTLVFMLIAFLGWACCFCT